MMKRTCTIAAILCFLAVGNAESAAKPRRLDLYDASGSMLMRIVFDYDGDNKNVTQTVYDPSGYVLRRVTLTGSRREYANDNGDITNIVNYSTQGEFTAAHIYDEFGKLLYQETYNTTAADNTYIFNNAGSMVYEYQDNEISRINIKDKQGVLTHYALADYSSAGISPGKRQEPLSQINTIRRMGKGKVYIEFFLVSSRKVSAELYDLKGTMQNNILDKSFPGGMHAVTLDIAKDGTVGDNGIYIIKFSLGSRQNTFKMKIVK